MSRLVLLLSLALVPLVVQAAPLPVGIDVVNYAYRDALTLLPVSAVEAGEPVTWTGRAGFHSVSADDGSFEGLVGVGDTFTRVFAQSGVVTYTCRFHPNMVAALVVR